MTGKLGFSLNVTCLISNSNGDSWEEEKSSFHQLYRRRKFITSAGSPRVRGGVSCLRRHVGYWTSNRTGRSYAVRSLIRWPLFTNSWDVNDPTGTYRSAAGLRRSVPAAAAADIFTGQHADCPDLVRTKDLVVQRIAWIFITSLVRTLCDCSFQLFHGHRYCLATIVCFVYRDRYLRRGR